MKLLLRAIAVGCGLGACWLVPEPARAGDPQVEASGRGSTATWELEGCRVALEYARDESLLQYDNGCPQSLAEKGEVLDTLLAAIFGNAGVPKGVGSFRAGWLMRLSPDLSTDVAWRAYESPEWKALLTKRREMGPGDHGMVSVFLARLIDGAGLYGAIERALREHGAVVTSVRVEKPFVGRPTATRAGKSLLARGVPADQLLPFDAIVTLVLDAEPDAAGPGSADVRGSREATQSGAEPVPQEAK